MLACATFPLIWMGGLVTSYGAGMAVPDWPTTYGYNLFLYPLESWFKVWDIFLEHGHRLLGTVVGAAAIVLAVLLWRRDGRPALWWLGAIAIGGVCLQGTLGGLRVTGAAIDQATIAGIHAPLFLSAATAIYVLAAQAILTGDRQRRSAWFWARATLVAAGFFAAAWYGVAMARDQLFLAKLHGCAAPLFFALSAAIVTLTSPRWIGPAAAEKTAGAWQIRFLTIACAAMIFLQIVLGANLRHIPPDAAPWWFTLWVWLHLIGAGAIVLLILWQWIAARRHAPGQVFLKRRILLLASLFLTQLVLGAATWVTSFGWPLWFTETILVVEYTVVAQGVWQALNTTAHVAVGSLCLAAATSGALWSWRLLQPPAARQAAAAKPADGRSRGRRRP